jgi:hypothetical protein
MDREPADERLDLFRPLAQLALEVLGQRRLADLEQPGDDHVVAARGPERANQVAVPVRGHERGPAPLVDASFFALVAVARERSAGPVLAMLRQGR